MQDIDFINFICMENEKTEGATTVKRWSYDGILEGATTVREGATTVNWRECRR
jgi:hypothetical protein